MGKGSRNRLDRVLESLDAKYGSEIHGYQPGQIVGVKTPKGTVAGRVKSVKGEQITVVVAHNLYVVTQDILIPADKWEERNAGAREAVAKAMEAGAAAAKRDDVVEDVKRLRRSITPSRMLHAAAIGGAAIAMVAAGMSGMQGTSRR